MEAWNAEVAQQQVRQMLDEPEHHCFSSDHVDLLERAMPAMADGRHQWLDAIVSESWDLYESVSTVGEVPDPVVIFAHAALARLCEIWKLAA